MAHDEDWVRSPIKPKMEQLVENTGRAPAAGGEWHCGHGLLRPRHQEALRIARGVLLDTTCATAAKTFRLFICPAPAFSVGPAAAGKKSCRWGTTRRRKRTHSIRSETLQRRVRRLMVARMTPMPIPVPKRRAVLFAAAAPWPKWHQARCCGLLLRAAALGGGGGGGSGC